MATTLLAGERSADGDELLPSNEKADKSPGEDLPADRDATPAMYATGFALASGLAVDQAQNLLVANYRVLGTIGRIAKDGTASVLCDLREMAPVERADPLPAGMKLDSDERSIVADSGTGRLLRIERDGSRVDVLADRCEGRRLIRVQDVALDLARNIYFCDLGAEDAGESPGSILRLSSNTGKTTLLDDQLDRPSGVGVTPDQDRLCVAESGKNQILIYDLSNEGTVGKRRVLVKLPSSKSSADRSGDRPRGMIFDQAGRLYVTVTSGFVFVIDVDKRRLIRQYPAGGEQATGCHFHGGYLYTAIASKEAVFRFQLGVEGFSYNAVT